MKFGITYWQSLFRKVAGVIRALFGIIPHVDDNLSLGAAANRWRNIFGSIEIGIHDGGQFENSLTTLGLKLGAMDGMIVQEQSKVRVGNTSITLALFPLTTTQRDAMTLADGMIVYNSTTGKIQGRVAGAWQDL